MRMGSWNRFGLVVPLFLSVIPAMAQTGVSDDRVSLPDGPGSRGGLGENVGVGGNMGLATYGVGIEVPNGFSGMTPQVGLSYNSGGVQTVVGMGWDFPMPAVERMTSRGLPRYNLQDDFVGDGAGELVLIPNTDPPVYRARFEGSFVRYTWINAGTGDQGYWKGEFPDGRVGYYGATRDGTLVPAARVGSALGTFRYHLVDMVDVFDHRITYGYSIAAGEPALLTTVGWVHDGSGVPAYTVNYTYEARQDLISDGKPGYELVQRQRLRSITVLKGATILRTATLTYEDYNVSGGFTRLARVNQTGIDGTPDPLVFSFTYSRALGGVCTGAGCQTPYIKSLGNLGGGVGAGSATLLDINGDALPDLLETPLVGNHTFRVSQLAQNGTQSFTSATPSTVSSNAKLTSARTVVLDLNGDGFTDLVNTASGQVLYNQGVGDWVTPEDLANVATVLPDMDADDQAVGPRTIQFLDYDNDKKIDVFQASMSGVQVWRNQGSQGFVLAGGVQALASGFGFDQGMQMADMNGDGLLDPVMLGTNQLSYQLNLGLGRWGPRQDVAINGLQSGDLINSEIEDINGDGLADLIVVAGSEVRYAVNRNGASFAPFESITTVGGAAIPVRGVGTTVLFADMNGNGSADVVWIELNGDANYLELFPIRPNLLSRVENGLGSVTDLTYTTAVEMMVQSTTPWAYKLPHSMIVVSRMDTFEGVSNVHDIMDYVYRDAYFDGVEKQFRGFGEVQIARAEEATQEGGLTVQRYDLGVTDRYRAGLELFDSERTGTRDVSETTNTYADCTVADIPANGLKFPIRHVCMTATSTILKEGAAAAAWVTRETRFTRDGYGNVTREEDLGITAVGGAACAACTGAADEFGAVCGAQCLGDEEYTDTTYVAPTATGGRWILRAPVTMRSYGKANSTAYQEDTFYYDGPSFVGLPLGQLTRGVVTRTTERVRGDATDTVDTVRHAVDAHGNVVESLDPLGTVGGTTHRTTVTYDPTGLRTVRVERHLEDSAGAPYQLRRDFQFDPVQDLPVEATDWMVVEGGTVRTARNSWFYAYDNLGRAVARARPGGDDISSPTEAYAYEFGNPVSRFVVTRRSVSGQAMDLEEIRCADGRGRIFQTRVRVGPSRYLVLQHAVYNTQGAVVREYQPWESTSSACETTPDANTPYTSSRYDALDRLISITEPDAAEHGGTASRRTMEYGPMEVRFLDEEDNETGSPRANTPTIQRMNGRGELVSETLMPEPGTMETTTLHYDEHGFFTGFTDASGNRKRQAFDLRGNPVQVQGQDEGTSSMVHDAMGNMVSRTDGRGITQVMTYDGLNRLLTVAQQGQEATTRVTYSYDKSTTCPAAKCTNLAGRLAVVTHPLRGQTADQRMGYDPQGRAVYRARTLDGFLFEYTADVDNLGRVTTAHYPKGRDLTFTYDGASRLVSVPGHISNVRYDVRGRVDQVRYANGVTSGRTYDARSRLTSITANAAAPLVARGFTLDRRGRVTAVADTLAAGSAVSGNAQYTYDARGRLTSASLDQGRTPAEVVNLDYDALNNILSQASTRTGSRANVGSYTYSAGSRAVTGAAGLTLAYDNGGYMTRRGTDAYTWDYQGRLTKVDRGTTNIANFHYGLAHERLIKEESGSTTWYPFADYEVRDGVSSIWLSLPTGLAAKIEALDLATDLLSDVGPVTVAGATATPAPDGAITVADAWVAQADQAGVFNLPGTAVPSDVRSLLASSVRRMLVGTDPVATYFHADHRNTPIVTTDASGAVTMRLEHLPYGATRLAQGGMLEDQLYTGKETDASTGLVFFGARYLDTVLGRWISPDPLFGVLGPAGLSNLGDSTSLYAYVGNDPIGHVDPMGLAPSDSKSAKKEVAATKKAVKVQEKKYAKERKRFDRLTKKPKQGGPTMSELAFDLGNARADLRDAKVLHTKALQKLASVTKSKNKQVKLLQKAKRADPWEPLRQIQDRLESRYQAETERRERIASQIEQAQMRHESGGGEEEKDYALTPVTNDYQRSPVTSDYQRSPVTSPASGRGSQGNIYDLTPVFGANNIYGMTPAFVNAPKLGSAQDHIYGMTPSFVGQGTNQ